jgi:hypothetical protein
MPGFLSAHGTMPGWIFRGLKVFDADDLFSIHALVMFHIKQSFPSQPKTSSAEAFLQPHPYCMIGCIKHAFFCHRHLYFLVRSVYLNQEALSRGLFLALGFPLQQSLRTGQSVRVIRP